MASLLISLPARCCGTCEHWTGERRVVEFGRRLACSDGLHPCPWRPSGSQARQRPMCMGDRYKPWQGLPVSQ